jgi:RimJ/RimL family protein N-acetyltransferase
MLHPRIQERGADFEAIMNMQLFLQPLEGHTIRLEPLRPDHAGGLWRVATPAVFTYASIHPADATLPAFRSYIERRLRFADWRTYTMVLHRNDQPVGLSAYLDLRLGNRGLEIGGTWIAEPYQGTQVNPEAKYLMLRYAFETLGMLRVQLKCDARNLQSQRALEKLGAKREGVLRKHVILPDGYVRDTVMYSIIDDDWPRVEADLRARLRYTAPHG